MTVSQTGLLGLFCHVGLPLCDAYTAETIKSIEDVFIIKWCHCQSIFVYMAQPLTKRVPAFCLACLSSDNEFCTDFVLNRWKFIQMECQKWGNMLCSCPHSIVCLVDSKEAAMKPWTCKSFPSR